jgi:NitT/TauT family transport system permease protein
MRIKLGPLLRVNGRVTPTMRRALVAFWVSALLLLWFLNSMGWLPNPIEVLPTPREIALAVRDMHWNNALVRNLFASVKLNVYGILLSTAISLPVAYLTVLPAFRPLTMGVAIARYLPIAGFTIIFMILFGVGFELKLALLTAGMSFFLVTSLISVVQAIPRSAYDHARVLGYNDLQVFRAVVARGTAHNVLEIIGQNSAIGWGMIIFIEMIQRSEGIGMLMSDFFKVFNLPKSYGCLLIIGLVAFTQDYLFQLAKRVIFPFSVLEDRG